MGFRTVFITNDNGYRWPQWFRDKYESTVNIPECGCISSKHEGKMYLTYEDLCDDLQKCLFTKENERYKDIELVMMHECGGITKVQIYKDKILEAIPDSWYPIDDNEKIHGHSEWCCDGCTNLENIFDRKRNKK